MDTPPTINTRFIDDIKRYILKEFHKLKSESQCIKEIKEIK